MVQLERLRPVELAEKMALEWNQKPSNRHRFRTSNVSLFTALWTECLISAFTPTLYVSIEVAGHRWRFFVRFLK